MIVGGRAVVFPALQTIQTIKLSTITLLTQSPNVYTAQGKKFLKIFKNFSFLYDNQYVYLKYDC